MPQLNVFYTLSKQKVFQPLFFAECTVTGIAYPDMVQELLMPILKKRILMTYSSNEMECLHISLVIHFLNNKFPEKWVKWGRPITWPSHPPDLTCLHFSLWQNIKDAVYMPPQTTTLLALAGRINSAAATVTLNTLNNMWTELSLMYSSCCVSLCGIIIWPST